MATRDLRKSILSERAELDVINFPILRHRKARPHTPAPHRASRRRPAVVPCTHSHVASTAPAPRTKPRPRDEPQPASKVT